MSDLRNVPAPPPTPAPPGPHGGDQPGKVEARQVTGLAAASVRLLCAAARPGGSTPPPGLRGGADE